MTLDDERSAFLRSICATPDDDAPRLIYADWLDERGESDEATFIRDQIHLARLPKWHPDVLAAEYLNREAFFGFNQGNKHRLPPLPTGLVWDHPVMRRGFGFAVETATAEALRDGLEAVCQTTPIEKVSVRARYRESNIDLLTGLTQIPAMTCARCVEIALAMLSPEQLRLFDKCPHWSHVEVLELPFGGLSSRGAWELPTLAFFHRLRELHLPSTDYGDPAGPVLARSFQRHGAGSRLEVLNLQANHFGPDDLQFLVSTPALATVRELNLSECAYDTMFREEGYQALAKSPHVLGLEILNLAKTGPNMGGMQSLANAPFPNLRWLDLRDNKIGPKGIAALVKAPWLPQLTYLSLQGNPVKDSGLKHLLHASLPNLVGLNLRDADLTDAGVQALMDAPLAGQLQQLNLFGNKLLMKSTGERLQKQFGPRVTFSGLH